MKKTCFYHKGIIKISVGISLLGFALGLILIIPKSQCRCVPLLDLILKIPCKCAVLIGTTTAGIGVALIVAGSILLWTYKRLDDLRRGQL
jgi:hypothetical protein